MLGEGKTEITEGEAGSLQGDIIPTLREIDLELITPCPEGPQLAKLSNCQDILKPLLPSH
jgi:hypothetical protein